jgi:hypothetical protein
MNITAAKMSGEEILAKYPILNTKWKYSNRGYDWNGNNGYYYSNYKDWSTEIVTDPWRRNLINNGNPIKTNEERSMFSTTVEGNKIILIISFKTY